MRMPVKVPVFRVPAATRTSFVEAEQEGASVFNRAPAWRGGLAATSQSDRVIARGAH
jgi:hypothetical protein